MARASSIRSLPPEIRAAVDQAVREGRTIDDIVAAIRAAGAEASRSAVGRYKQGMEAQLRRYREAQEVAGVWVQELRQDPEGKVGRLLAEMLKTAAFNTLSQAGDGEEPVSPQDLHFVARMLKDLGTAEQLSLAREARVRELVKAQAVDAVSKVAAADGLSAETIGRFRAAILGVQGVGLRGTHASEGAHG